MKEHWKGAAEHFAGRGIYSEDAGNSSHGPELHAIKKQLNYYEAYDKPDQHAALLCAATGATWPRVRKAACGFLLSATCARCEE